MQEKIDAYKAANPDRVVVNYRDFGSGTDETRLTFEKAQSESGITNFLPPALFLPNNSFAFSFGQQLQLTEDGVAFFQEVASGERSITERLLVTACMKVRGGFPLTAEEIAAAPGPTVIDHREASETFCLRLE